jgi:hypothetical protein
METIVGQYRTKYKRKTPHQNDQKVPTTKPNTQNPKEHETRKVDNKQQFHSKIRNLTDVHFTENENTLLSKGLKYNLHYKPNNWIRTLAIEAETAISYMKAIEQNCIRQAVVKSIKQLLRKSNQNNTRAKHEWKTLNNIKEKLTECKLIITQADKGKTIVVIYEQEYLHSNKSIYTYRTKPIEYIPKQLQTNYKTISRTYPQKHTMEVLQHEPTNTKPPCTNKTA